MEISKIINNSTKNIFSLKNNKKAEVNDATPACEIYSRNEELLILILSLIPSPENRAFRQK